MSAEDAGATPKLLALPRDPNPYQERLYGEMRELGWRVAYGADWSPSHTLNLLTLPFELVVRRLFGWRVLHVHWVFGFMLSGPRSPALLRMSLAIYVATLATARRLGYVVVWTAHNVLPHNPAFADDLAARRRLVRAAGLVIAHSRTAVDELEERGLTPRNLEVIPHGPLHPPEDMLALRAPRAGGGPLRVLFFGQVHAYKGVEELLAAVLGLPPSVDIRVSVVGACPSPELRRRLEALAARAPARIELRLERIPDEEVPPLLAAADVVALPFRAVTTSASALLAMAAGRTVLLPDLPAFADVPADAVIRYDGSVGGLGEALAALAGMPTERFTSIGVNAVAFANDADWRSAATQTDAAVVAAIARS